MRRRHKILIVALVAVFLLLASAGTVLAFTTYNNHVLNGGVGNYGANPRYFYIVGDAIIHKNDIYGAVWDWNHTYDRVGINTPVYWDRTYTQSASVMDIYYGHYYDDWTGIYGVTEHILNNNVISPYLADWNWGKIKLNSPLYDTLGYGNQRGTVAHEMGHLMGLGHSANIYRIMCQLGDGRVVTGAWADDCWGINYLY